MSTHHAVFPSQPDDAFIAAWRTHIEGTGYPELFNNVSTSKPEQDEGIELLSEEILVPVGLREGGSRVPCPFCSRHGPKFERGRMAYFPIEHVVRFIGRHCAIKHFGENYHEAEKRYRQQAACREYIAFWKEMAARRDELEDFFAQIEPVAGNLAFVRRQIDDQAPGFATFLYGELVQSNGELVIVTHTGVKDRHGNAVDERKSIGRAVGRSLLAREFDPKKAIDKAKAAMHDLNVDLPDWSPDDHETTMAIVNRGWKSVKGLRYLVELRTELADAQRFLEPKNLRLIERWANDPSSPIVSLTLRRDGKQLLIRSDSYAGKHYSNAIVPETAFAALPPASHPIVGSIPLK